MALSTTAVPAFGALFKLCADASATNPTTVAEVRDFNYNQTFASQESTTHSTSTPDRTYIITLRSGTISIQLNFVGDNGTQDHLTGLKYVADNRLERTYQIEPVDGTVTYQFNAVITGFQENFPVDGIRNATCNFQISGPVSYV